MKDNKKSCPFCAGKDIALYQKGSEGFEVYWLSCRPCNIDGPVADSKEGAIDKWNYRPVSELVSCDNCKWKSVCKIHIRIDKGRAFCALVDLNFCSAGEGIKYGKQA